MAAGAGCQLCPVWSLCLSILTLGLNTDSDYPKSMPAYNGTRLGNKICLAGHQLRWGHIGVVNGTLRLQGKHVEMGQLLTPHDRSCSLGTSALHWDFQLKNCLVFLIFIVCVGTHTCVICVETMLSDFLSLIFAPF